MSSGWLDPATIGNGIVVGLLVAAIVACWKLGVWSKLKRGRGVKVSIEEARHTALISAPAFHAVVDLSGILRAENLLQENDQIRQLVTQLRLGQRWYDSQLYDVADLAQTALTLDDIVGMGARRGMVVRDTNLPISVAGRTMKRISFRSRLSQVFRQQDVPREART